MTDAANVKSVYTAGSPARVDVYLGKRAVAVDGHLVPAVNASLDDIAQDPEARAEITADQGFG